MSQPQTPRSNPTMQFLLLMTTVFLGYQLITGSFNAKPETRSSAEILKNIRELNRMGKDVLIQSEIRTYDHKLDEMVKAKQITDDVRKERSLEAHVLGAQTALRGGIYLGDNGKVGNAYNLMNGLFNQYAGSKYWTEPFPVAYHTQYLPQKQISASELYEKSRVELSARNKKDLIVGFIPGYQFIDSLVALTGRQPNFSYAFAAFLLAVLVRAIVWPLAQKQFMYSRQMMQLQPLVAELKKKHTKNGQTDSMALQQDSMKLYSEYGINPAKGCLPALIQMPFFLLVFQCMMHYRFEFENGVFLWINPSMHAMSSFFAPNLGKMDNLLLIVYSLSMIVSTYLQPVTDPSNQKQQRTMGLAVAVIVAISMFFYPLPSAFVLYWIFLNIFSTIQALYAYRLPVEPLQKVQTAHGGVKPKSGFFERLLEQQQLLEEQRLEAAKADPNSANGTLYKPKSGAGKKSK